MEDLNFNHNLMNMENISAPLVMEALNLDFLSTPPRQTHHQVEGLPTPINRMPNLLKDRKPHKKKLELAQQMATVDELIRKVEKYQKENGELQKQLKDFQKTASQVQNLYSEEKQNHECAKSDLKQLREQYDNMDVDYANKIMVYDQMKARLAEYEGRPINYDNLLVKYVNIVQKLEGEDCLRYSQDKNLVEDLKHYCAKMNIKINIPKSPKKAKSRTVKPKTKDVFVQCTDMESKIITPKLEFKEKSTKCQVVKRDQGSQYISTMITRQTNTEKIIQKHVSTMFPEPKSTPPINDILNEFCKWANIQSVLPLEEDSMAASKHSDKICKTFTTTGTCTMLCNIRRKIDYFPSIMSGIKQELATPSPSPIPTAVASATTTANESQRITNPITQPSSLPSNINSQQNLLPNSILTLFNASSNSALGQLSGTAFNELWQIFGTMLLSLLQTSNAGIANINQNSINQQQFLDWLLQLYISSANTRTEPVERRVNSSQTTPLRFNESSVLSSTNVVRPKAQKSFPEGLDDNQENDVTSQSASDNGSQQNDPRETLPTTEFENFSHDSNSMDMEIQQIQASTKPITNSYSNNNKTLRKSQKDKNNYKIVKQIQELFPEATLNKKKRKELKRLLKDKKQKRKNKKNKTDTSLIKNENNDQHTETAVDFLKMFAQKQEDFGDNKFLIEDNVTKTNNSNENIINHPPTENEFSNEVKVQTDVPKPLVSGNNDDFTFIIPAVSKTPNLKSNLKSLRDFRRKSFIKPKKQPDTSNIQQKYKILFGDSDNEIEDEHDLYKQHMNPVISTTEIIVDNFKLQNENHEEFNTQYSLDLLREPKNYTEITNFTNPTNITEQTYTLKSYPVYNEETNLTFINTQTKPQMINGGTTIDISSQEQFSITDISTPQLSKLENTFFIKNSVYDTKFSNVNSFECNIEQQESEKHSENYTEHKFDTLSSGKKVDSINSFKVLVGDVTKDLELSSDDEIMKDEFYNHMENETIQISNLPNIKNVYKTETLAYSNEILSKTFNTNEYCYAIKTMPPDISEAEIVQEQIPLTSKIFVENFKNENSIKNIESDSKEIYTSDFENDFELSSDTESVRTENDNQLKQEFSATVDKTLTIITSNNCNSHYFTNDLKDTQNTVHSDIYLKDSKSSQRLKDEFTTSINKMSTINNSNNYNSQYSINYNIEDTKSKQSGSLESTTVDNVKGNFKNISSVNITKNQIYKQIESNPAITESFNDHNYYKEYNNQNHSEIKNKSYTSSLRTIKTKDVANAVASQFLTKSTESNIAIKSQQETKQNAKSIPPISLGCLTSEENCIASKSQKNKLNKKSIQSFYLECLSAEENCMALKSPQETTQTLEELQNNSLSESEEIISSQESQNNEEILKNVYQHLPKINESKQKLSSYNNLQWSSPGRYIRKSLPDFNDTFQQKRNILTLNGNKESLESEEYSIITVSDATVSNDKPLSVSEIESSVVNVSSDVTNRHSKNKTSPGNENHFMIKETNKTAEIKSEVYKKNLSQFKNHFLKNDHTKKHDLMTDKKYNDKTTEPKENLVNDEIISMDSNLKINENEIEYNKTNKCFIATISKSTQSDKDFSSTSETESSIINVSSDVTDWYTKRKNSSRNENHLMKNAQNQADNIKSEVYKKSLRHIKYDSMKNEQTKKNYQKNLLIDEENNDINLKINEIECNKTNKCSIATVSKSAISDEELLPTSEAESSIINVSSDVTDWDTKRKTSSRNENHLTIDASSQADKIKSEFYKNSVRNIKNDSIKNEQTKENERKDLLIDEEYNDEKLKTNEIESDKTNKILNATISDGELSLTSKTESSIINVSSDVTDLDIKQDNNTNNENQETNQTDEIKSEVSKKNLYHNRNDSLEIENDLMIDEDYEDQSNETKENLCYNENISTEIKFINNDTIEEPTNAKLITKEFEKTESLRLEDTKDDTLNSSNISTLLNSSICNEILTDSINPIVNELMQDEDSLKISPPETKTKRGRKRKSEWLADVPQCKRSQRLKAKQMIFEQSLDLSKTPIEIGKYTKSQKLNIKDSKSAEKIEIKKEHLNQKTNKDLKTNDNSEETIELLQNKPIMQIGFFKDLNTKVNLELSKELETKMPIIQMGFFKERINAEILKNPSNQLANKINSEKTLENFSSNKIMKIQPEKENKTNCEHKDVIMESMKDVEEDNADFVIKSKLANNENKTVAESTNFLKSLPVGSSSLVNSNTNFETKTLKQNKNSVEYEDSIMESISSKENNAETEVVAKDLHILKSVPASYSLVKSHKNVDTNSLNNEQSLNEAFCVYTESPKSPPPPPVDNTSEDNLNKTYIIIPEERELQFTTQHKDATLFDTLINSYSTENHLNTLPNVFNNKKYLSRQNEILSKLHKELQLYCYDEMELEPQHNASKLLHKLLLITEDYNLIQKSLINIVQMIESPNVAENELPSIIQEMPPRHLPVSIQRLFVLLQHFLYKNSNFCQDLILKIESLLFTTRQQSEKLSLKATLNLTQFYLMTCKQQESMEMVKHSARYFIAKCLYYYNKKAILMVHEVLLWYPTVLPHREDATYDRSDALITVIQEILMNTKYDMENQDLRGKSLISKLRYEYHYEVYKPTLDEVVVNLVEKLKNSKFYNISMAFALMCKRLPPLRVQQIFLNGHLLPLAKEYYNYALLSSEYDKRISVLLEIISMIVKPFPVDINVEVYLNEFSRFLNGFDRPVIQVSAVCSILRLQRFGYVNCFNLLRHFKPNYDLDTHTQAMLKTFLYRKPLNFWKTIRSQNPIN